MASQVLIVRLLTGEEIIGSVDLIENPTELIIENPTRIQAAPNSQTGNIDVHLAPWMPMAEHKKVSINRALVLCTMEPVVEIKNKFNSVFGSGLIIP